MEDNIENILIYIFLFILLGFILIATVNLGWGESVFAMVKNGFYEFVVPALKYLKAEGLLKWELLVSLVGPVAAIPMAILIFLGLGLMGTGITNSLSDFSFTIDYSKHWGKAERIAGMETQRRSDTGYFHDPDGSN